MNAFDTVFSQRRVCFAQHALAPFMITISEPDEHGHWGKFGGRYVPETLVAPLEELTNEFMRARGDENFWRELNLLLRDYAGRPTPLFHAQRLTAHAGGAQIYLKREDLLHTGAHKINNALGQALLARRMGKHRVIAETGAGQHGVATATVCGLFGFVVWSTWARKMCADKRLTCFRMRLLGAECHHSKYGHTDAEGRYQRGVTRLGDECSRHLLLVRQRAWTASLSADGPRISERHRTRSARTNFVRNRQVAVRSDRMCRRRIECDRIISSVHWR